MLNHPRHEAAFFRYVNVNVDGGDPRKDPQDAERDVAWATSHPHVVLAEGDRACRWLAGQPTAPDVDPSNKTDLPVMEDRYLRETQNARIAQLTSSGRWFVVEGAWAYLCGHDRSVHTTDGD